MSRALVPWFRPWVRSRLRRGLDGVWVSGLEATRQLTQRTPVIFAASHVSWWDGLLVCALEEALDAQSRILVDAQSLARLPFLLWAGGVPLDRTSGRRARRDLIRAAELLAAPRDALWIFPQGDQRPPHLRPLGLKSGVELLRRSADAPVVPVAIQYVFFEQDRPSALVHFGEPASDGLPALERSLVDGLDRIDGCVLGDRTGFVPLLPSRTSRAEDGPGTRLLAWLARPAATSLRGRP